MSVMTAGERRRRAGAAPSRRGRANAPAGHAMPAGDPRSREPRDAAHPARRQARAPERRPRVARGDAPRQRPAGTAGYRAPILTVVPAPTVSEPGRREAATRAPERPRRAGTGPGRRAARARVRLTRRGRVVVAVLITSAMVLVAGLAWLAGTARADAAGSGPPPGSVYRGLHSVVVQPGQSLWTIASRAEPSADPRGVIQEIIDLNALGSSPIQPGQRLWLPRE